MSAVTDNNATAPVSSLASSAAFRKFAVVFGIATPVIYVILELGNWPLFTYYPAVDGFKLGYGAGSDELGPAMHWYGWTVATMLAASVLGLLATKLPENAVKRIPLSLVWILPVVAVPILIYSLRFYWRW